MDLKLKYILKVLQIDMQKEKKKTVTYKQHG